ncbi:hypothetical protein ACM42_16230 [Bradyrhizobium sp. CCBAU 25338]|nr:hypothetical protein [Bradyrhizobium sp. CCBAU 25338]
MWDGTSLLEAVPITEDARSLGAAKLACEQHFATSEAQQRLGAMIEAERREREQKSVTHRTV